MVKKKPMGKKLRKFSIETRFKSANEFKKRVLGLFKDYIKSVIVWGSIVRGDFTGKSDVDIYIIFDDTKMPIKEFDRMRPKIDADIFKIAKQLDPRLHPQPVIALTDFWDGVRNSHPLFYNIVREGFAVHDTGFFIPLRKLLEWGKFPATPEAAYTRISTVPKRLLRVRNIKALMVAEDLFYAVVDAAQAILMYIGVPPPPPKTLAREVKKHLVDSKLLEPEYEKLIVDIMNFRKAVEHKELKTITGKDLDKWIGKVEKYVKTMDQLLKRLEMERKLVDIHKNYEFMMKASIAALRAVNKLPQDSKHMPAAFQKYIIDTQIVNPHYGKIFDDVITMYKKIKEKTAHKIPERDVSITKEYVRRFVIDTRRIIGFKDKINIDEIMEKQAEAKMAKAKQEVKTAKEIDELPPKQEKPKKKKAK